MTLQYSFAAERPWMPAALCVLAAVFAAGAHAAAPAAWKPDKAIELIAVNAPGGGADRILRIMAKVLQEGRLTETPIVVVNKPGGGGSVAYAYLNQNPGGGHHVVMANKSLLTNNLVGQGPSYTEITPLANLFNEYIAVTVKPDSPFRSGRELIERLKKDSGALSFGVAGSLGNPSHQGVFMPLREAGVDARKVRTVIFQSGGAASTALLGGHIDFLPITAALAASMLRGGQLRLVAVTSPVRLPGVLADVPTWREQGYNAEITSWRSIVGPKGMAPAQIAYWEDVLRRMSDSDEWKKELEMNFWTSDYMGSAELRKHMDRDNVQTRAFLVDVGLAK